MKELTSKQIFHLISFSFVFDQGNREFWKLIKECLNDDKIISDLSTGEALGILNNFKEMDTLSNKLLNRLAKQL